ncbi:MAG: hypothetical protein UZ17_ACD001000598 [Acidobacteria bacterium OLB17]|nr:MAG: hypothetical protein UZ17_ACD001000598 [Acidobacteria bacterium OLB17]
MFWVAAKNASPLSSMERKNSHMPQLKTPRGLVRYPLSVRIKDLDGRCELFYLRQYRLCVADDDDRHLVRAYVFAGGILNLVRGHRANLIAIGLKIVLRQAVKLTIKEKRGQAFLRFGPDGKNAGQEILGVGKFVRATFSFRIRSNSLRNSDMLAPVTSLQTSAVASMSPASARASIRV